MRIATAKQTYQRTRRCSIRACSGSGCCSWQTTVRTRRCSIRMRAALLFPAAALALFPFVADAYWLYLAWFHQRPPGSDPTGYTGLVGLSAAFMGLGAYTVAVLAAAGHAGAAQPAGSRRG